MRIAVRLILAAGLCGCTPVSEDDAGPPGRTVVWANQHRVPTSGHLRAVRFWTPTDGIIAGESTSFFRTRDGGATWTQHEHTPSARGGDVAAMDVAGTFALVDDAGVVVGMGLLKSKGNATALEPASFTIAGGKSLLDPK